MSLVENIKSLCEIKGLSIPKLEKHLGFSRGSIYNWNTSSPSIDKVQKVADFFNVPLDRVIYGFNLTEFVQLVNYVKDNRTIEQFARDTGINENELYKICLGLIREKPSLEIVQRIASSNPVDYIVSTDDLMEAAGYISERQAEAIQKRKFEKAVDAFDELGFIVRYENEEGIERVYIDHHEHGTVESMFYYDFLENWNKTLELLSKRYKKDDDIQTLAAHHDGEDWTPEELEEIERFKEFVRMRRKMKDQG